MTLNDRVMKQLGALTLELLSAQQQIEDLTEQVKRLTPTAPVLVKPEEKAG